MVIDLRGEKALKVGGVDMSLFGRVFNLFDTRFFNGAVFDSTGSPYYSALPGPGRGGARATRSRFYPPRRIEVGFRLGSEL